MQRRDMLRTVVAGASAGVWAQISTGGDWKPALFNAHQNETVIVLTELIIPATDTPGAKAALVNRFLDLILSESPASQRKHFLDGLAWLDDYAKRRHGAVFLRCTPAQQTALLASLDPAGSPTEDLRPGVRFFEDLKRRTVAGYYTSKIGVEELNKGGRVPASYGCTHPGGHSSNP